MGKEIKNETNFWGETKQVVYEDGDRIGEVRKETTWLGETRQGVYTPDGERVATIEPRTDIWGDSYERIADTSGTKIGEVTNETSFFGEPYRKVVDASGSTIAKIRPTRGGYRIDETATPSSDGSGSSEEYASVSSSTQIKSTSSGAKWFGVLGVVVLMIVIGALMDNLRQSQNQSAQPTAALPPAPVVRTFNFNPFATPPAQVTSPSKTSTDTPTETTRSAPSIGEGTDQSWRTRRPTDPDVNVSLGEMPLGSVVTVRLNGKTIFRQLSNPSLGTDAPSSSEGMSEVPPVSRRRDELEVLARLTESPRGFERIWIPIRRRAGEQMSVLVYLDSRNPPGRQLRVRVTR
jgi:hypothetical protein